MYALNFSLHAVFFNRGIKKQEYNLSTISAVAVHH